MRTIRTPRRALATALAASLLALAAGCGDDSGLPPRYKVYGTVNYNGKPVEKAVINFIPLDAEGRGAAGQVENGNYELTTQVPGDGALPGKYKVTVDAREIDTAKLEADAKAEAAKKGLTQGYSMVPQHLQAKALKESKNLLPGKYQIASTTDIEVEVKEQSNSIPIELKD